MSYYDGISYGLKLYKENLSKYGFSEYVHREKIIQTCKKYASDFSIKKTKSGKYLTKQDRLFYKGVADCLKAPNRIVY